MFAYLSKKVSPASQTTQNQSAIHSNLLFIVDLYA
jgi:hypothetical protein